MCGHPADSGAQPAQNDLPSELRLHILSLLPPNDLALGGRLSSRDAAQRFREVYHRTANLSWPLPPYAAASWEAEVPAQRGLPRSSGRAAWQPHLQRAVEQLRYEEKHSLLAAAAASGSEVNLEVAWHLLRPCVFPEL